jgi:Putative peptidoglycan binding domain
MISTQDQLVAYVRSLTGIQEEPLGSNHVIWTDGTNLWRSLGYGFLDGARGGAWCGAAGYKIDQACGNPPPYRAGTAISCPALEAWAKANHRWTQTPSIGDKVIFKNGSHQGTVIDVSHWDGGAGYIMTGEGNWSDRFIIRKRTRAGSEPIDGFVQRGYAPSPVLPPVTVPEQKWSQFVTLPDGRFIATHVDYWVRVGPHQKYAVATMAIQYWLTRKGFPTAVDGAFETLTEGCVRRFQTARNLPVTGLVDAATAVALDLTTP